MRPLTLHHDDDDDDCIMSVTVTTLYNPSLHVHV
jgi:hypothetical protein